MREKDYKRNTRKNFRIEQVFLDYIVHYVPSIVKEKESRQDTSL